MKKVISGAVCAVLGGALVAGGFVLGRLPRAGEPEPAPAPDATVVAASPGKPAPTEPYAPKAFGDGPPRPLPPDPNAPGQGNRYSGWERTGERELKTYEHVAAGRLLAPARRNRMDSGIPPFDWMYSVTEGGAQALHRAPLHWPQPPRMRPPAGEPVEQVPRPFVERVPDPISVPWPTRGDTRVTSAGIYALDGTTVQMFAPGLYRRWTKNLPVPKDADPNTLYSRIVGADDSHVVICCTTQDHRPKGERTALVTLVEADGGAPRTCEFQLSGEDFVWGADPAHERFYVFGKEHVRCRSLKDGKQLWEAKFAMNGSFARPIVTDGGGVLVRSRVHATWYDADGRAGWSCPSGLSHVATADGTVFALANGTLTAAELTTGKVLWHTKVDDRAHVARVAVDDKSLYAYGDAFGHTSLYRLHRETGVVCWHAKLPECGERNWKENDYLYDEYPRFEPHGHDGFFSLPPDRETKHTWVYRISGL